MMKNQEKTRRNREKHDVEAYLAAMLHFFAREFSISLSQEVVEGVRILQQLIKRRRGPANKVSEAKLFCLL